VLLILDRPHRALSANRAVAVASINRITRSEWAILILQTANRIGVVLREVRRGLPSVLTPGVRAMRADELRGQQRIPVLRFPLPGERDALPLPIEVLRPVLSARWRVGHRHEIGPAVAARSRGRAAERVLSRLSARVRVAWELVTADQLTALALERNARAVTGLEVRDLQAIRATKYPRIGNAAKKADLARPGIPGVADQERAGRRPFLAEIAVIQFRREADVKAIVVEW